MRERLEDSIDAVICGVLIDSTLHRCYRKYVNKTINDYIFNILHEHVLNCEASLFQSTVRQTSTVIRKNSGVIDQ
jgi:hypothetical protein